MSKPQEAKSVQPAAAAESTSTRPIARFSGSGGLTAAVWKHKSETGPEHYSIQLDRSFRTESGSYETTSYLREGDLLRAQRLLGQVDDWIEQERAKHRGQAATGQAR